MTCLTSASHVTLQTTLSALGYLLTRLTDDAAIALADRMTVELADDSGMSWDAIRDRAAEAYEYFADDLQAELDADADQGDKHEDLTRLEIQCLAHELGGELVFDDVDVDAIDDEVCA